MLRARKAENILVSALRARTNFGRLLQRVEDNRHSLVIAKRGRPRAVLLSIRDYVWLAAPEPEVLKALGVESKLRGSDRFTSRKIDAIIKRARAGKAKR
jgi:prevent-host-death family protein